MGKIKINSDNGNVYEIGSIVNIMDFIDSFCGCTNDESLVAYIYRIPIPSAVDFIADAWGIDYEFV